MTGRRFGCSAFWTSCASWSAAVALVGLASFFALHRTAQCGERDSGECPVDELRTVEQRVLPTPLKPGVNRYTELTDYYWDQNAALKSRIADARHLYEQSSSAPFRRLTLVAGAPGIGKTFIKGEVFDKKYPKSAVCKFDLRELYEDWQREGHVISKAELAVGPVVLNSHLAQKSGVHGRLTRFLEKANAAFYVIDSLDEIHPDDCLGVLEEIERFALSADRHFVHVVVFGRGFAFREYWRRHAHHRADDGVDMFVLQPPRFVTTGDLEVSSWNYHNYKYKLAWSRPGGPEPLALTDYQTWLHAGFPRDGEFAFVTYKPNAQMTPNVHQTLVRWACRYPVVDSMLVNLAGNGMIRQIVADWEQRGAVYDERDVMDAYFAAWLERETSSEGRPSRAKPEHLDLYLRLLEETARNYARPERIDARGFFEVSDSDTVTATYRNQTYRVATHRLLEHSGLVDVDLATPEHRRMRFEPVWFQRLLVDHHSRRSAASNR